MIQQALRRLALFCCLCGSTSVCSEKDAADSGVSSVHADPGDTSDLPSDASGPEATLPGSEPASPGECVGRDGGTGAACAGPDSGTGDSSEPGNVSVPPHDTGDGPSDAGTATAPTPNASDADATDLPNETPAASTPPSASTPPATVCRFDVLAELSPAIASVGIVRWSVDLAELESAHIDFGTDAAYGQTAPVDLAQPEFRTLLLGMPAATDVHFRVVATAPGARCESEDIVLTTGAIANGLSLPDVETLSAEQVSDGYLVTSRFTGASDGSGGAAGATGQIYILNKFGQIVWWFSPPIGEISRALMSYDGQYMYAREVNVQGGPTQLVKISMDGLRMQVIQLPDSHHDFTVTPDNGVTFIRKATDNTCDDIMKLEPDGSTHLIYHVIDAYSEGDGPVDDESLELCHTNSIHYHAADDSYTYSDLYHNVFVKITAQGELLWVLGGDHSDFIGDGAEWNREHGHQMLGPDRILFFNNADGGDDSIAREVQLDLEAATATRVWAYEAGIYSATFGDVQRLTNGNTLVTYSNAGIIHEVDPDGALVQSFTWGLGGAVGYSNHRASLYGPARD